MSAKAALLAHTPNITITQIAQEVAQEHQLREKFTQQLQVVTDANLEEFLKTIAAAVTDFLNLVLDPQIDPLRTLFDQDLVQPQLFAQAGICYAPSLTQPQQLSQAQSHHISAGFTPEINFSSKDKLYHSLRYSLLGSGKMMRPALVFAVGNFFGADPASLLITGAAIECLHTYSLIHDDLPAMDNDDYRRGRLSSHKVFGADHAILAGDSLQTLAFALLSNNEILTPDQVLSQVRVLANGAGHYGMCLGQSLDLLHEQHELGSTTSLQWAEGRANHSNLASLMEIHYLKTAQLIATSGLMGLYAGVNNVQATTLTPILRHWGYALGLAFQIKDDILDVVGNASSIGKKVGSDLDNHKLTYTSLLGLEAAQAMLTDQTTECLALAEKFVKQARTLAIPVFDSLVFSSLTKYVTERTK